jgi:sugar lactone lactonase YvrE
MKAGLALPLLAALALSGCGPEPRRHDFRPEAPSTPGGLEQVAEFDSPLANVAVSPEGRVFVTFHPLGSPEVKVAEVSDGRAVPYPDRAWQTRKDGFQTPQGIKLDTRGRLWVLDYGKNGLGTPALIAFDIGTGKLAHRHDFTGEEAGLGSYLNDLSIDADAGKIYIADTANYNFNPALIVYDIASGKARRVLEDHKSVKEEPIDMVVEGEKVKVFGIMPLRVAVDSIVLDLDSKYLYYGPMSGTRLYRVPVAALLDASLSGKDLAAKVEDFAPKPVSDGITIDRDGNIYLTAIEQRGVVVIHPDGRGETLLRDDRLVWPDGFSFGPAGWIYVADSHLNRILFRSKDRIARDAPFVLYRFKALAPGLPGR